MATLAADQIPPQQLEGKAVNLTILPKLEKIIVDNMPIILSGVGVVGTIGTAYLTYKATFKAVLIMQEEDAKKTANNDPAVTPVEALKLTWLCYLPPVAAGVGTISAIVLAQRINMQRAAALALAYSIGEKRFEDYRAKMLEKLGINKEELARAEITTDKINENPPAREGQILIIDGTDVLCLDQFTGRYFKSSMEKIKAAENEVNHRIVQHGYASLGDFYEKIGLPSVGMSEEIGWQNGKMLDLLITSAVTPQGVPCLAIDFTTNPIRWIKSGECKAG